VNCRRGPSRAAVAAALAAAGLATVVAGGVARADRTDEAWRRGNEAYLRGDYAAAVAAYEQLDAQGVLSPDVYFNLGSAQFRRNALGPAIWAFERALVLDPVDEDARYNLEQARKLAARRASDRIEGEEREAFWVRAATAVGPATQTWTFVVLYVGLFVVLIARSRVRDDLRPALGAVALVAAVGALLCGLLLVGRARLDRIPYGVILPDAVAVHEGADAAHRTSFDVHAGLRVRVVDRDQDWLRIRLANGLEGWVRAQDIGRL
jgi:tetratricopeptide (TPR) repeat protein